MWFCRCPLRWIPDGVEAIDNCGNGVGVLIEHTVDSSQYPRACVPSDLDHSALLSLSPDWIKLVFKDPIIFSFLLEKLDSQEKLHAPPGRVARSWVALTSAIRASSASLPPLACMPSAISTPPMSTGSSPSTLHVEKTAAAPSTSNSSLAPLSILTQGSYAGSLTGWGTRSSRSVNGHCGRSCGGGESFLSFWNGLIEDGPWLVLCEYFFNQVIHCSHGARWAYTLYHLPLNGNLDGGQTRKFLSHRSCCTTPLTPIPALTTELLLVSNPYPTTPAGLSA